MKIIHTADLHLDSKLESNLSPEQAKGRRDELLETFGRMVAYAAEQGVSVILIAGDLFDKAHVRKRAKRRVLEEIVTHPQIDFLYLQGNHDRSDFLSDLEDNEIPKNLKTFKEKEWTAYEYGDVVISGRELSDDNYKTISVNLILDESKLNIVTLHGQESDYVGRDRTHIIQISQFRNKFIDYLALGHIHSYKCERLDDRGEWCYPGCLEGRGFDECGEKGFVLLEIDEETRALTHRFVPFAKRQLHEVSVEVSEKMNMPDIIAEVRAELARIDNGDLIKAVLTGTTEMDFDVDCERLTHIFEREYYFFKVYDRTGTRIDYDSFAGDRSLKGEFVRLMQQQDMSEEERAAVIELGMKAILGEELG